VAEAVEGLREEIRALRTDLTEETRSIWGDLSASQRQIAQIGSGLIVAFSGAVIALIGTVAALVMLSPD
jgi:hypothetical protein